MHGYSNYRLIFLTLICTLFSGKSFPQNIPDSLQQKLEAATPDKRPEVLNLIAETLAYKFPAEALGYANDALKEAQNQNNRRQEISALLNIGDCHYYANEFQKALDQYKKALEKSVNNDYFDLTARSHYYLAWVYHDMNNLESAGKNYKMAIEMYDSLKRPKLVAELSSYYADILSKHADNYMAKNYYEIALKNYDSLLMTEEVAETLNSMGLLFYSMGNYEKAVAYYNQSLNLMKDLGNKSGISQALNNLGILYQNWGNPDEALKYYQESLRLEIEDDDKLGIAGSYNNIGIIFAEKGKNIEAIDYYQKSLAFYEELDDKSGIATALNNLGESYMDMGKLDKAGEMLKKSLALEKELQDKFGIALAYVTMADIYFRSNNLKLSRKYCDSSLVISNEIKNPEITLAVLENLYKLSEAEGSYQKALRYFVEMSGLKDSLFNKNLHKQLSEVKAQYELEQKEQQIALLNSKNKVNQLDLENKQDIVYRQRLVLIIVLIAFSVILVVLFMLYRQVRKKKAAYKSLNEKNKELTENREELIIARDKAEESDRLKSTFLANMSHELRTPLNGILGFTEVLRTEIYDEVYREMADIVHTSGTRLLDTLNSIIDLSIIESNRMEIEQNKIDLEELIEEAVTLYRVSAFKKDLLLTGETDSDFIYIISDRKVLENLLNNLIDNALKYTREGSVQVKGSVKKIKGTFWLEISVKDTGIGIEPERLEHIFEKFRQGSEGHNRQFEGAGLGLTICKKYVELLHGKITAHSQPGNGSEFRVTIPVTATNTITTEQTHDESGEEAVLAGLNYTPRVLIVENDDINLKHLVYTLKDWCEIKTAYNGNVAIQQARENKFDIILMDINLGAGPNGMQTAKKIRLIDGFSDIPIIAVTANAMKGHREEFLANGCTHYLSKPFTAEKLKKLMIEALKMPDSSI
jgi:signal transduction histidine kinase/Tfp pilus assembly protein PilF/ActR/RegA family two-component response regulator